MSKEREQKTWGIRCFCLREREVTNRVIAMYKRGEINKDMVAALLGQEPCGEPRVPDAVQIATLPAAPAPTTATRSTEPKPQAEAVADAPDAAAKRKADQAELDMIIAESKKRKNEPCWEGFHEER